MLMQVCQMNGFSATRSLRLPVSRLLHHSALETPPPAIGRPLGARRARALMTQSRLTLAWVLSETQEMRLLLRG